MLKTAESGAGSGKDGVREERTSLSAPAVAMSAGQRGREFLELINSLLIVANTLLNPFARVEDGGVVASSERLTDGVERRAGEFAGEMDRQLARPAHARRPAR